MTCDDYHAMRLWPEGRHTTAEIRSMFGHVQECSTCKAFLIVTMIMNRSSMTQADFDAYMAKGQQMADRVAADPETAY